MKCVFSESVCLCVLADVNDGLVWGAWKGILESQFYACRHVLVHFQVGATNRPEELDEAARRRMPKQLYIPLPCAEARRTMILHQLREWHAVLECTIYEARASRPVTMLFGRPE